MIRNAHMRTFAALFAAIMVISMMAPVAGAAVASGADDVTTDFDDVGTFDAEVHNSLNADDVSPDASAQATGSADVDPALREAFRTADGDTVEVVARLPAANLDGVSQEQALERLERHAEDTQTGVIDFAERTDGVDALNQFHIANAVLLEVDPQETSLEELTEVRLVERLHANFEMTLPDDTGAADASTDDASIEDEEYTYGLEMINAPDVWNQLGVTGEGAGVAILDTGLDNDHPDFDIDPDNFQEFDGDGNPIDSEPNDGDGHGTHVSGTAVGPQDPDGDVPAYGVAPDAELYSAKVLDDTGGGTFAQINAGMEWAAEEDDVDVVGMSLGANGYISDMIEPAENIRNAGQVLTVSIGNAGQGASGSPGNYYSTFASGAVDEDEMVASFSSGEVIDTESAWGDDAPEYWPDEYVQPNAGAPGVGVLSAYIGPDYDELSGTSMSQPHKAGTFALMASAMGDTNVELFEEIIEDTAEQPDHAPDDDPNTEYGHGIINALSATQQVALDSGIEGTVTDGDGEPIEGATVMVEETGVSVETDESGHYELIAEPGEYTVTATGFGFGETTDTVEIPDDETVVEQDFELDDALGVELLEGQPDGVEGGDAFEVVVDVANLETYTVERDGDYAGDLTFELNGDEIEAGEPVDLGGITSEATLSVTTEADTEGDLSLDHTFEGLGDSLDVATGPTQVFEEFIPVAVVDDADVAGEDVADTLDDELLGMYDVSVVGSEEATDGYDVVVVQNLEEGDPADLIDATEDADVGVVYLDQWGSDSNGIPVHSDVTGDPADTFQNDFVPSPISYEIDADHPIFDGIGDPGDIVDIHTAGFGDHTWFEGTDADVLAQVADGSGAVAGDAFAVDDDSATVYASSLGYTSFAGSGDYTSEADALLGNSVAYVTPDDEDETGDEWDIVDVDPSGDFTVTPGAELAVDATVENTGDEGGTATVEFVFAGDTLATETIELDAGEQGTVTFEITAPEAEGEYDWYIALEDDQSDIWTLTVEDDEEPADATVSFGDGEFPFAPGETGTVTMNTSADDVAGYEVFVDFDPDVVQIDGVENADIDGSIATNIDNENGTFAVAQAQASGVDAPDMIDVELTFLGDHGDMTDLVFDADSALFASDGEIDADFEDATLMAGQIGDVNNNGEISAFDAILIQKYLAGEDVEDDFYPALADVTQDGEIHTGDVIALLNMIVDGDADGETIDAQQDATSIDAGGAAAAL